MSVAEGEVDNVRQETCQGMTPVSTIKLNICFLYVISNKLGLIGVLFKNAYFFNTAKQHVSYILKHNWVMY